MYLASKSFERLKDDGISELEPLIQLGYTPVYAEAPISLWFKRFQGKDYLGTLLVYQHNEKGDVINGISLNAWMYLSLHMYAITGTVDGWKEKFVANADINWIPEEDYKKWTQLKVLSPYLVKDNYDIIYGLERPNLVNAKEKTYQIVMHRVFKGNLQLKIVTVAGKKVLKEDEIILTPQMAEALLNAFVSCEEEGEDYIPDEKRLEMGLLTELDTHLLQVMGETQSSNLVLNEKTGYYEMPDDFRKRMIKTTIWGQGLLKAYETYLADNNLEDTIESIQNYWLDLQKLALEATDKQNETLEKIKLEKETQNGTI
jgi:hypothetical protein